ncbi:DUF4230 domain-containing protein [Clostridiales bacterium FE2010]|nr:DUF4230 domain-containing protein [Clostridiales bacterium FE2010]
MKKLSTRQLLIIVLAVDILLGGIFILTSSSKKTSPVKREMSGSNIQRICELATLDCFYHNVSDWSQSAYNFLGYGAKKVWIEYDGIVRVGIKAGKIKISNPDKDDVITVTIPEATILSKDLDENSIYEIDSEASVLGFVDHVNLEDRTKALANAQEDMEACAAKDEMILGEAHERAKKIIERNILTMGQANGKEYKVKFIDTSDAQPSSTEEKSE